LVRFDEAREQFREVLRIDPDDPDAHCQLGTLLMEVDAREAADHLERTLEQIPHHEAACYRLFTLMRDLGEDERAQAYLERFQILKAAGAGQPSGMKYGEMGRYGNVIRAFGEPQIGEEDPTPPPYEEVALAFGLIHPAGGEAGWPGARPARGPAAFGPGIAVGDVDGDGDLDIYRTQVGQEGAGNLYLGEDGSFRVFKPAAASGIDGRGAVGAFFGDYDGDGDPDLFLTRAGPNRLFRNVGDGRFEDATQSAGVGGGDVLSVGAAWADADHDGDLDLYVANYTAWPATDTGAPNALWRNDGDGTFTDVASEAGVDAGAARTASVVFFDADDDRDADLYLVNDGAPNRLFLNDRVGQYTERPLADSPLADTGAGIGACLGDVDQDGREDLLLISGAASVPPRLLLQVGRGRFVEDAAFAAAIGSAGGVAGALLGDLDLDGDPDVVLLDAETEDGVGHRILMNRGAGRFAAPAALGGIEPSPRSRGAVIVDLDGDGMLELLVDRAGKRATLWRAAAPEGRRWLQIEPSEGNAEEGFRVAPTAVGLQAEVKAGQDVQVSTVRSTSGYLGCPPPRLHFGLGETGKADYVRLVWADGVLQSEMEVAADQLWRVAKVERKPSSCPILFAWDGTRFRFITDFLGVGGCGFFIAPGVYAPPDPTEDVRIPPGALVPEDGKLLLRIAEPLEEVSYFDQMHLVAYDHPAAWELHPDERFTGSPPFPTGEPIAVAERIPPVSATTDRGQDVLDRLRDVDRRYVEPPLDERFVGFADDHWLELDFGDRLRDVGENARLVLHLHGWVEYTYSHVNYAAWQAGVSMRSPSLEVPDGNGGWRTAIAEIGFPAGLPRVMTVDVSDVDLADDARVRIRSNMEVFWDRIWIGVDVADERIRRHVLPPDLAELRMLGYPREFSPDGGNPTIYDYHRL
ncbi:MAG: FG-GAP-like repeat-containing protein, partial [Planctomycetota bacterium]